MKLYVLFFISFSISQMNQTSTSQVQYRFPKISTQDGSTMSLKSANLDTVGGQTDKGVLKTNHISAATTHNLVKKRGCSQMLEKVSELDSRFSKKGFKFYRLLNITRLNNNLIVFHFQ